MSHLRSNGVYAILSIIAIYTLAHWMLMYSKAIGIFYGLFYYAGGVAFLCMSMAIVISIRPKAFENSFGGLDRMYQVHKWLGITAMVFFLLHFATSLTGGEDDAVEAVAGVVAEDEDDEGGGLIGALGMYSMIAFVILIVLTLNRRFAYHRWIKTHLLMGVAFFAVSLHVWLVLQEGNEITMDSVPGAMLLVALIAGVLAYLYKQTFYRTYQRHPFLVAEVNAMERATEVVLKPEGRRFNFRPGQFAFVKIAQEGFDEYHPFTISSGNKDGQLRFTMKVLGDYTRRVRDGLTPGAKALVEGPYGRFNPLDRAGDQVWIAGGIGITPFLSALRSIEAGNRRKLDLFYCVREDAEALFLDEIRRLASDAGNVTVHLLTSSTGERLSAEYIERALGDGFKSRGYFFCGPKLMLKALMGGLTERGVPANAFHFEEFEMR